MLCAPQTHTSGPLCRETTPQPLQLAMLARSAPPTLTHIFPCHSREAERHHTIPTRLIQRYKANSTQPHLHPTTFDHAAATLHHIPHTPHSQNQGRLVPTTHEATCNRNREHHHPRLAALDFSHPRAKRTDLLYTTARPSTAHMQARICITLTGKCRKRRTWLK